ncbi:hypothetical protein [uncultured Microbulbifer sp.]|uniref:hypothetical protein n=1 Tax=uncultured Microbulbifer sp. TaxID=348147 RepID=UPI00344FA007
MQGFQNYFGLPDNSRSLSRLYRYVLHSIHKWLNQRSHRKSYNWNDLKEMLGYFRLKAPRVYKRSILVDWY